ncbi:MAG: hypothetical protein HeimC3_10060 [Candidatus Heimdallarchaeota archaeon LC_3]|nr:MAG: hypothetical protein HeimC3_10060 [Candidatus Heimdallarchaeota archaeon LC_3]
MSSFNVLESKKMFEEDPDKSNLLLSVESSFVNDQATIQAGDFVWHADFPPPLGGSSKSPSPIAQLLGALTSCAVLLIKDILAPQFNVNIEGVKASITASIDARGLFGTDNVKSDLQRTNLDISIQTKESEDNLKPLFLAFQERCPVFLSFIKGLDVTSSFKVV